MKKHHLGLLESMISHELLALDHFNEFLLELLPLLGGALDLRLLMLLKDLLHFLRNCLAEAYGNTSIIKT
jgi:hypothetical protein